MTLALLRCDATPEGGVGHLVRALSVAQAARAAGWQVEICGTVSSPLGEAMVVAAGIEVVDPGDDLAVLAAERGATLVHVDDYAAPVTARANAARADVLLSSMEDGAFGRRPADVVVDPTVGAQVRGRPDDGSGEVLLGVAYAPMRPEVRAARDARAAREASGPADRLRAVVVMGGTDAVGAAPVVAAVCARSAKVGTLTVVAPPERWEEVRAAVGPRAVELVEPFPGLLDLAAASDVVVSAAGTTAWELACIGVRTLLVPVVDNQRAGYRAALELGLAEGLGVLDELRSDVGAAARVLDSALAARRPRPRETVDGEGAARVVEAWHRALEARSAGPGPDVTVVDATHDDALVLLRWRNDAQVRAVSREHGATSWSDHQRWFASALERDDRMLLVARSRGRRVGTARFDRREAGGWEVSITLAPEQRGRGIAGRVLSAAELHLARRTEGPLTVVAAVRTENVPSRRLFEAAGYEALDRPSGAPFGELVKRLR